MTKEKRVLPADVFDALEFSALVYGGIGGMQVWDHNNVPCCAIGHAVFATNDPSGAAIMDPLERVGIGVYENDRAVSRVNIRRGEIWYARVPFAEWAKALNVVRGA